MKSKLLLLAVIGLISLASSTTSTQKEIFYYSFDKKIPLVTKSNTLFVKYSSKTDKYKKEKYIKELIPSADIKWHNPLLLEIDCKTEKSKEEIKSSLMQMDEVKTCVPSYTTQNGHDIGITDEILVRFLPNVQSDEQEKIQKRLKTKVVEKNEIFQLLTIQKGQDALEIANQYYETGLCTSYFVLSTKYKIMKSNF